MGDEENRERTLGVLPLPSDGNFTEEDRESTLGILPLEDEIEPPVDETPVLRGGGVIYLKRHKPKKRRKRRSEKREYKKRKEQPIIKAAQREAKEQAQQIIDLSGLENVKALLALYEQEKGIINSRAQLEGLIQRLKLEEEQGRAVAQELIRKVQLDNEIKQQLATIQRKIAEEESLLLLSIVIL